MNENQMAWHNGELWLSPKGKTEFSSFSNFPQYAGETIRGLWTEAEFDQRIGCKVQPLNHSHGWFVYQKLLKDGWKLVSYKRG
jgi:hypothetical protein